MGGDVRGMEKVRYAHKVLVGKPERKTPRVNARRRLNDKNALK
jgi:hypothetical protein